MRHQDTLGASAPAVSPMRVGQDPSLRELPSLSEGGSPWSPSKNRLLRPKRRVSRAHAGGALGVLPFPRLLRMSPMQTQRSVTLSP